VKRLAVHASSSSTRVADLLWQLLEDEPMDPIGVVEWLKSENFVQQLLAQLAQTVDVATAALSVVGQLIERSNGESPIVQSSLSGESVSLILAYTFENIEDLGGNAVTCKRLASGLDVLRAQIEWCIKSAAKDKGDSAKHKRALWLIGTEAACSEHTRVSLEDSPLLLGISHHLHKLAGLLASRKGTAKFGTTRLEIGRFLSALLRSNNSAVVQRYIELKILPLCLDLFFAHTLLNMWHHQVLKMVMHTLAGNSAELVSALFNEGQILQRVISSLQEEKDGYCWFNFTPSPRVLPEQCCMARFP